MLDNFLNSLINIYLKAKGDLEIDAHHTIEDTAILRDALSQAMGERSNINRYASSTLIMDEARAQIDIDLCTRSNLNLKIPELSEYIGDFPSEMLTHFLDTLVKHLKFSCHIDIRRKNFITDRILFKCLGKVSGSLKSRNATSTKGIL